MNNLNNYTINNYLNNHYSSFLNQLVNGLIIQGFAECSFVWAKKSEPRGPVAMAGKS